MHVLVDYDNVKRFRERSRGDVEANIEILANEVMASVTVAYPEVREVRMRLYGGWRDERGNPSRNATWLAAVVGNVRGRKNGVRLLPVLANEILCHPSRTLIGTVRFSSSPVRQKMVDAMLSVDVIFLAKDSEPLAVVSDDDDLVPACMVAGREGTVPPLLLRRRAEGSAMNDAALAECGVKIAEIGPRNV